MKITIKVHTITLFLFTFLQLSAQKVGINGIVYELKDSTASVIEGVRIGLYKGKIIVPEKVSFNKKNYTVTSIGENTFEKCTELKDIRLPNSIKIIESSAFYGCDNLDSIRIPDSVTHIGDYAFSNCENLRSVKLSNSLKSIGRDAFRGCKALSSITLPNSLDSIHAGAFSYSGLKSICIPENVKYFVEFGESAFESCTDLKEINVSKQNKYFASYEGVLYSKNKDTLTLICFPPGKLYKGKIVVPKKVSLNKKTYTVTAIGENAFEKCMGLRAIRLPNSIKKIEEVAFSQCNNLESIKIPNSVTYIGAYAFSNCENLKSVKLSNSLKSIGLDAFRGCKALSSITLPNSLDSIMNGAFRYSGLKSIYIPEKVKFLRKFGGPPFEGCTDLKEINVSKQNKYFTSYKGNLYSINKDTLTLICFPPNKKRLEANDIPQKTIIIGGRAFINCKNLEFVDLPSQVKIISGDAFANCTNLEQVILPDTLDWIGSEAFSRCTNLKEIKMPVHINGVEFNFSNGKDTLRMWYGVFKNCEALTSIILPRNLNRLSSDLFSGCTSLQKIDMPEELEFIGPNVFLYNISLQNVYIPESVKEIYSEAFNDIDGASVFDKKPISLL